MVWDLELRVKPGVKPWVEQREPVGSHGIRLITSSSFTILTVWKSVSEFFYGQGRQPMATLAILPASERLDTSSQRAYPERANGGLKNGARRNRDKQSLVRRDKLCATSAS